MKIAAKEQALKKDALRQRAYGDRGYVFYQIPAEVRHAALIFQHGGAQTKRTWETTPDGREGFQNIFLKKRLSGVFSRSAAYG